MPFRFRALCWLIQIEQKAHERQALARKLDDFLGNFLYGSGHVLMLGVKGMSQVWCAGGKSTTSDKMYYS
jgi:hypothetical protein